MGAALTRPETAPGSKPQEISVSPQAMQACAEAAADGQYLRIEGGGHAPFLTHGDEVAIAIRQFAAGLSA
jgi:pimeloyl-[acyl-carrier protein] methyl ester esterase